MSRGNDSNSNQANARSRTGRTKADRDNRSRQLNPQDIRYRQSRTEVSMESRITTEGWRNRMSREDAARIQSNADRTGKDDGFKERSQRQICPNCRETIVRGTTACGSCEQKLRQ